MGITKYCHHSSCIEDIARRYPAFMRLKGATTLSKNNTWHDLDSGKKIQNLQIAFFGKSGYGKSSTLNGFTGMDILETSDVSACTRECQCVNYETSQDTYLSLVDFPGLGENELRDKEYMMLYKSFLESSDVIVYVLRADMRDYSIDRRFFDEIQLDKKKLLLAMNFCDKIEPVNRSESTEPNMEQLLNIENKMERIAYIFNSVDRVIPYSSGTGWNMQLLAESIVRKVLESKFVRLGQLRLAVSTSMYN